LVDPLCFGPLDRKEAMPEGVKHPRYLMNGVVSGIRDYGNRIGIPTVSGGVFFDKRYTMNCLVNVCSLGFVKRDCLMNNYAAGPGEIMILFGGRTGRDGIHGVNFASKDMKSDSESESRGAVQLGDPITKEPVIHACVEIASKHLITGMKDLGGGGLSCVVGEMAIVNGCGADVNLDKVPLKEEGLAAWEIWVSESQERMMCTCTPENLDRVMEVFDMWDIVATPIAKTTDSGHTKLFWKGDLIFDMDIGFLTGGPVYDRPIIEPVPSSVDAEQFPELPEPNKLLLAMMSDLNVASKEWVIRQYDHEVRAATVVHPMVGKLNETGPGDASVLRPRPDSYKGLAVAVGCNPWFTEADPYNGGMASVDEACRNIVAVGARPDAMTDCLNFGNPEIPEKLGIFKEAIRGIGDAARGLDIPIPSGNVSMYNESPGGESILPTPMLVCCGLMDDIRKAVTADMKAGGSRLYVVGSTFNEMGGSLLFRKFGGKKGDVPKVNIQTMKSCTDRLLSAMDRGCVLSCHDCSDGGLAITVAEMCISGQIGAKLNLSCIKDLEPTVKLYSESNTRWVVEVAEKDAEMFEEIMGEDIGYIGESGTDRLKIPEAGVDLSVSELKETWNRPVWDLMGSVEQ